MADLYNTHRVLNQSVLGGKGKCLEKIHDVIFCYPSLYFAPNHTFDTACKRPSYDLGMVVLYKGLLLKYCCIIMIKVTITSII